MELIKFYEGTEIFVTGGSGVVGKALVETLLRTCNVKRIYVLLRPKKDMDADARLKKIADAKIFRVLRSRKPRELEKLTAIAGDAVLPNLGVSKEDAKLMKNVSIVFHCAATVRFDEPLKEAMTLNVGGTEECLRFAETLKNLKIFLHVSTFYSNPYLKKVESKLYPPPMDWRMCMKLFENPKNYDMLDALTSKMISGFPNTYTFTKNLAENLVNDWRNRLPVAIYRPSIVLSALKYPEPGFPPAIAGATGLFVAVAAGLLKTVYLQRDVRLDITPLDLGVHVMMYYAMRAAREFKELTAKSQEVPVYLFSSDKHNPFTFKEICERNEVNDVYLDLAYEKHFLVPGCIYTSNRVIYMLNVYFKQVLPAMLLDGVLKLSGRPSALMPVIRKVFISLEVMKPFLWNTYDSTGISHIDEINEAFVGTEFDLSEELARSKTFKFLDIHMWNIFTKIREVLLHEDPSTIQRSRIIITIKNIFYHVMRLVFAFYLLRWFYGILLAYF